MQQLSQTMTAQEFGQHYALELEEPVPAAVLGLAASIAAGLANGPLKPPARGRLWCPADFMPKLWQLHEAAQASIPAQPSTVEQIMAQARAAGMVQ